jgi:hypothetical protein
MEHNPVTNPNCRGIHVTCGATAAALDICLAIANLILKPAAALDICN